MNLIERRKRRLIVFTILCVLVFALFIGVLIRNSKVVAATCPACQAHPTLSAATCAKPATCPYCGYQEGTTTNVHNWKDATCTEPKKCSTCGKTTGAALGHSMQWAPDGFGMHKMVCSRCKIVASGTSEACTFSDATCTEPKKCSKCGATGDALGHSMQWVPDGFGMHKMVCSRCKIVASGTSEACTFSDATCTEPKKCSKCGATGTALGHVFGKWLAKGTGRTFKGMREM